MHNALELWRVERTAVALEARARLAVNATRLAASGAWVRVSWSGMPTPRLDDTVALYSADADPRAVVSPVPGTARRSRPHPNCCTAKAHAC